MWSEDDDGVTVTLRPAAMSYRTMTTTTQPASAVDGNPPRLRYDDYGCKLYTYHKRACHTHHKASERERERERANEIKKNIV